MGITKLLIDDWIRERRIKKHRAEIERLMSRREPQPRVTAGSTGKRRAEGRITEDTIAEERADNAEEAQESVQSMADYDASGQLDVDLEDLQWQEKLKQAVLNMNHVFRTENQSGSVFHIECAHDGQNIHTCVKAGNYIVGKWRFMLPADNDTDQSIHLYHLNYYHNQTPGPNYHFQKEAKGLYTPEDTAVYILRHDKKKYLTDQKKNQTGSSYDDSLITE